MTHRKVKFQCTDEKGEIKTFTVDQNGKQNSPSFESYYDLLKWSDLPENELFRKEMRATADAIISA